MKKKITDKMRLDFLDETAEGGWFSINLAEDALVRRLDRRETPEHWFHTGRTIRAAIDAAMRRKT